MTGPRSNDVPVTATATAAAAAGMEAVDTGVGTEYSTN